MEDRVDKNQNMESDQVITAFEQILEVMPDDLFALEALHDAYLANGDTQTALKHLYHIADIVEGQGDNEVLTRISDKLLFMASEHPDAEERANALQQKIGSTTAAKLDSPILKKAGSITLANNIRQEIALAWKLFESGRISKSDYSEITNDLTEMSSNEVSVPVSVLHVLQDRAVSNLEKILLQISKESGTPLIGLLSFDVQMEAVELLPFHYLEKIGAIPFDFIGEDLMVAILNPFNTELRQAVIDETGRASHFYLVSSTEYDNTLSAIRKMLQDQQAD